MTAKLTIGLCGLDVVLDNPESFDFDGEQVSLDGDLFTDGDVDEAKALRQQLLGYLGTVQPVTWAEDPHADGFYLVASASVSTEGPSYAVGCFRFRVSMIRRPNYQGARFTLRSRQPDRLNSTVTATPWVGLPSTLGFFDIGSDAAVTWYESRVGPGGTARYLASSTYFEPASGSGVGRGVIAPAHWYDMSPQLKVGGRVVTGSQIPILSNLDDWSLDNGLVKFESTATAGALFKMSLPDTSGTPANWGTAKDIEVGYYDGSTWRKQTDLVSGWVMRSDAQEIGIKLFVSIEHPTNSSNWEGTVSLRLRRGGLFAECHITGGRALRYGIVDTSISAGTASAFTGNVGFYKTSDDTNGNQPVAMSFSGLTTTVLADGKAYLATGGRRIVLGLGGSLGSGASLPNRATDLLDQFGAGGSVTINVGA